ncbi:hypothetical protein THAOC_09177, partial [Thalassiosira oceanica]
GTARRTTASWGCCAAGTKGTRRRWTPSASRAWGGSRPTPWGGRGGVLLVVRVDSADHGGDGAEQAQGPDGLRLRPARSGEDRRGQGGRDGGGEEAARGRLRALRVDERRPDLVAPYLVDERRGPHGRELARPPRRRHAPPRGELRGPRILQPVRLLRPGADQEVPHGAAVPEGRPGVVASPAVVADGVVDRLGRHELDVVRGGEPHRGVRGGVAPAADPAGPRALPPPPDVRRVQGRGRQGRALLPAGRAEGRGA